MVSRKKNIIGKRRIKRFIEKEGNKKERHTGIGEKRLLPIFGPLV